MQPTELKDLIDEFFVKRQQNEGEILKDTNTIEGLIDLIISQLISNGCRRQATEKAKKMIEQIQDPRILWGYIGHSKELLAYPQLQTLRDYIVNRVAMLILAVSYKSTPQWFVELLSEPKKIPDDFLVLFCEKVKKIREDLDKKSEPELVVRTYEQT